MLFIKLLETGTKRTRLKNKQPPEGGVFCFRRIYGDSPKGADWITILLMKNIPALDASLYAGI